jgi:hypothetical protein
MSFFNERFDFFKKVDDPNTKGFIGQIFYEGMKNMYSQKNL